MRLLLVLNIEKKLLQVVDLKGELVSKVYKLYDIRQTQKTYITIHHQDLLKEQFFIKNVYKMGVRCKDIIQIVSTDNILYGEFQLVNFLRNKDKIELEIKRLDN